MSEWNYVVAAYALTWISLAGYVLYLARRLSKAAHELESAGSSVGERE